LITEAVHETPNMIADTYNWLYNFSNRTAGYNEKVGSSVRVIIPEAAGFKNRLPGTELKAWVFGLNINGRELFMSAEF
jgi:hypothetical protein